MVRIVAMMALLVGLAVIPARGQDVPPVPPAATEIVAGNEEIGQWIHQLGAKQFELRDRATQSLIRAGRGAIPAVLQAVNGTDREVALRAVVTLQEIGARGDVDALQAALTALEGAARGAASATVSRQAVDALATLTTVRQDRAVEHLKRRGAVFTHDATDRWYQQASRSPFATPVFTVEFGPQWQGTEADLERLSWITDVEQVYFVGPQVTDNWFVHLRSLPKLHSVKVKRAQITNRGLAHLTQLDGIWFLRLMYVPLDDTAVPLLENAKGLRRLVVISRQLTEKGTEQLQQHLGKDNVDCPRGALLGIEATIAEAENWTIKSVLEGSAAAKAGILEDDRIVRYNGEPVTDFRSLRALISRNEAGDTVTLEIERGLERLTKQVTFGEWD